MPTANETILREAGYYGTMFGGIDIGTHNCGWAFVGISGNYLKSGFFKLTASGKLYDRMKALVREMNGLARRQGGSVIMYGIEDPWVGKNLQTAMKLSKAWGAAYGAIVSWGGQAMPIAVPAAKTALTGSPEASKENMLKMARTTCSVEIDQFDEADAIGVALATRKAILEKAMEAVGRV